MRKYIDYPRCAKCGGICCKSLSGSMSPDDTKRFTGEGDLAKALYQLFATGSFAIDWWEGDPRPDHNELDRGYYVRPKTKTDQYIYSPSWGGECVFLTHNGCALNENKRPSTCLLLEPKEDECVLRGGGKRVHAVYWIQHVDLLTSMVDEIIP